MKKIISICLMAVLSLSFASLVFADNESEIDALSRKESVSLSDMVALYINNQENTKD